MYQEIFDGAASLEIHLNSMFTADVLAALTHAFYVWYYNVELSGISVIVVVGPFVVSFLVLCDVDSIQ